MKHIREQIERLRSIADEKDYCGVDAGRTGYCHAGHVMEEAADTLEALLRVAEAAHAYTKTEHVYPKDKGYFQRVMENDEAFFELERALEQLQEREA